MSEWVRGGNDVALHRVGQDGATVRARPSPISAARIWWYFKRALILSLIAVPGPALVGFAVSDYFRLCELTVRAKDIGLAEEVALALSDLPALKGASALFPPLQEITTRAQTCPRVLRVEITRDLPRHLWVDIEERCPLFVVKGEGDYVFADEYGMCLLRTGTPPRSMTKVILPEGARYTTGATLPEDELIAAFACIRGAMRGGLGLSFELDLRTRYDYRLKTPSGTPVWLGGPDNLQRKVIKAAALERRLRQQGQRARYMDARAPDGDIYYVLQ
jgi:hypothetical protein